MKKPKTYSFGIKSKFFFTLTIILTTWSLFGYLYENVSIGEKIISIRPMFNISDILKHGLSPGNKLEEIELRGILREQGQNEFTNNVIVFRSFTGIDKWETTSTYDNLYKTTKYINGSITYLYTGDWEFIGLEDCFLNYSYFEKYILDRPIRHSMILLFTILTISFLKNNKSF